MTEALRAQFKETLMEQQLCSDQHEGAETDAARLRNAHLGIMGLNLDTAQEAPSVKQHATPTHTSRKNVSLLTEQKIIRPVANVLS